MLRGTAQSIFTVASHTIGGRCPGVFCPSRFVSSAASMKYDNVFVEQRERVGIIQLNRPKVRVPASLVDPLALQAVA